MKASELIKRLQELVEEHGDYRVSDCNNADILFVTFDQQLEYDDAILIEFKDNK